MKKLLFSIMSTVAAPLHGKGIIDKHAPFLLKAFQYAYVNLQKKEVKTVSIPLNSHLKVLSNDTGIGLPLIIKGEYEPLETSLFLESVNPGDTIIDIGANVGYYTVLASKKAGKKGNIYAFEVDQETLALLKDNLKENHCSNVTLEEMAISDSEGEVSFTSETVNKGESAISYQKSENSYTVPCTTLDLYLKRHNIKKLDILKIDIEGAEILAFEHASTLSKYKGLKLFVEYNPASLARYSKDPKELLKLLEKLNFKLISIVDESRKQILPYSYDTLMNVLKHTTYCNMYGEIAS